jgi:hypothetical protein
LLTAAKQKDALHHAMLVSQGEQRAALYAAAKSASQRLQRMRQLLLIRAESDRGDHLVELDDDNDSAVDGVDAARRALSMATNLVVMVRNDFKKKPKRCAGVQLNLADKLVAIGKLNTRFFCVCVCLCVDCCLVLLITRRFVFRCAACFEDGARSICSKCKVTKYCSVECQTRHW